MPFFLSLSSQDFAPLAFEEGEENLVHALTGSYIVPFCDRKQLLAVPFDNPSECLHCVT